MGAVARQRLRAEFGRLTNRSDASQRQPVGAANLTAKRGAVATGEALQKVMPLVDERGQPVVHRVTSMPKADKDQGRGDATALGARVADAARQSSGELDEPLRLRV